jgi:pilus assembly protein Flp/PilA
MSPEMTLAYNFLRSWMESRIADERAASLVEYALLLALIAVVCVAALTALGGTVSDQYSEMASQLD